MNERDEKRLSDVETGLEILKSQCEDCKDMQVERLDVTNKVLGELRDAINASDERNIRWHIKNLYAVVGAFFTFTVAIIVVLIKLLK